MPAATEYLPRLRGQLVLDWDDPIFSGPLFVGESGAARKKLTDLVSKNSEDAVTWSVFRTLSRLNAADWLPHIIAKASFIPIAEPGWGTSRALEKKLRRRAVVYCGC